jgi:uncharacterized protein (TIGR03437 family)
MKCFQWVVLIVVLIGRPIAYGAASQWNNLGGSIDGKVSVAENSDGRLEAFARWQDNSLRYSVQTSPGSTQWSGWTSVGGSLASNPVAAVNNDGRLEVFAIGPDTAIWHTQQTAPGGASWSAWSSLGGQGAGDPAIGVNADGRLDVYIHTTNNSMWHTWQTAPGGNWAKGTEIVGDVTRSPAVARNSDGRLVVFVGDIDGRYWWIIQNTAGADSWSPWWCLLGGTVTAPLMGTNADGRIQLFMLRADGSVWTSFQMTPGSYSWSDWSPLGGSLTGELAVNANSDGRLELFGRGNDNALWHAAQTSPGGAFAGWQSLGGSIADSPSVAADSNGLLQVFAPGGDTTVSSVGQSSAGSWAVSSVTPSISSTNAVVPVWSGKTNFSSNMYVTIYGSNLSTATQAWDGSFSGGNAPTSLGGVSVTVNNIPAFIQYVSSTQVNINVPDDSATGAVNIVLRNSAGASNTGTATRARLSPTFLTNPQFSAGSKTYVVAQTPDFSKFIGPPNLAPNATFVSARPGDTITIFATGCGPTIPATQAGAMAAQNSPLALGYQVKIAGVPADVHFAGMVAGTVGLYQFNIVIPNVAAGDQPIEMNVDGVSNAQNLVITVGQ